MKKIDQEKLFGKFSENELLDLMFRAGFKEPKNLTINGGWATVRCSEHKDIEDSRKGKKASCKVNFTTKTYVCKSCGHSGNLITLAYKLSKSNYYPDAIQYLLDYKNINKNDIETDESTPKRYVPKEEHIEYFSFDKDRPFKKWKLSELEAGYSSYGDLMKYKTIMTFLIVHSLRTNQEKKLKFLCGERKIDPKNPILKRVGYLPKMAEDKEFWKEFEAKFPIEDLVRFGIYNAPDAKYYPLMWKYHGEDFVLFPNQDLYSNLFHGMQLRFIKKPTWANAKEVQFSQPNLIHPIPFALSREVLLSDEPLVITEGSVDGLSSNMQFSANPGVNMYYKPYLGLYRGKKIFVAYDMDLAGYRAVFGYKTYKVNIQRKKGENKIRHIFLNTKRGNEKAERYGAKLEKIHVEPTISAHKGLLEDLKNAGVNATLLWWNPSLGKDLNELIVKHGPLKKSFFHKVKLGE